MWVRAKQRNRELVAVSFVVSIIISLGLATAVVLLGPSNTPRSGVVVTGDVVWERQ